MASPRKRKSPEPRHKKDPNTHIIGSGDVIDQPITRTLEENFMPYAMSAILSRALPEIDGFKPSHRKLLYTMYKKGLLTGIRTKSANIVGETMKLNPHGDMAIYETMVRLAKGNEALLHPYVDSKGNFGKYYSRDMAFAAPRYTEAKLEPICAELFRDIDKDTVDFIPNYDNTTTEPTLFPATFPSILVNNNVGIAVSMASKVCSFNLKEICETTASLIKHPDHDLFSTLKGPDFSGGGFLVHDPEELKKIYDTGRGSLVIRSRWQYDESANCIEVTQIPPTTTIEAIIEKVVELIRSGKIREVSYIRDETDLRGLKITLDLKRGVDPNKLMTRLFRMTPLQDIFSCNFNILIGGTPKVMGVREILTEWTAFRTECVRRRVYFDLAKQKDKLHLLSGLQKILLDIDKAIKVVRETENDEDVSPNLMIAFGIDHIQAEYVAEIKLRHLNRDYVLKRLSEVDSLKASIAELEDILSSENKIKTIIIQELAQVAKNYHQPRKTLFCYPEEDVTVEEEVPDYPVNLFCTKSGYFKKITPQSLRMSGEQKLKEGDEIALAMESANCSELLFFTDKAQVYKAKASQFDDTKASVMGDYIPAKLSFDEGESLFRMVVTQDFSGFLLFVYENGKVAKVELSAYMTKTNRKKLANACSDKSPLVEILHCTEEQEILIGSTAGRALVFHTTMLTAKSTRDSIGVQVLNLKKNALTATASVLDPNAIPTSAASKLRVRTIPAAGVNYDLLQQTI